MVDQKHIQITVAVIIEEAGLGRERAGRVEAVLGGAFGELGDCSGLRGGVDKQLVSPRRHVGQGRVADVDIEPAVGVDVGHGHARFPVAGPSGYACGFGHVLKSELAFVEIQLVGELVGGEI